MLCKAYNCNKFNSICFVIQIFLFLSIIFNLHLVSAGDMNISGCVVLDASYLGKTIDLNSDIVGWSGNCFPLNVDDDDNYLEIDCNGHTISTTGLETNFFYSNNKNLAKISFLNCIFNIGDTAKFMNFEHITQSTLDINLQSSYLEFQDTGTTGIYIENSDINKINIYDLNMDFSARNGSFIYLTGTTDINYFDITLNDVTLTKGYFTQFHDIIDNEINFEFNNSDINFYNTSAFANNAIGFYFYSGNVGNVYINNLNVIGYTANNSGLVYVTGATADVDNVTFNQSSFDVIGATSSLFKAENTVDNDEFGFKLNDSNVNIKDGNLIVVDNSDYNKFYFEFYDSNIIDEFDAQFDFNNANLVYVKEDSDVNYFDFNINSIMQNNSNPGEYNAKIISYNSTAVKDELFLGFNNNDLNLTNIDFFESNSQGISELYLQDINLYGNAGNIFSTNNDVNKIILDYVIIDFNNINYLIGTISEYIDLDFISSDLNNLVLQNIELNNTIDFTNSELNSFVFNDSNLDVNVLFNIQNSKLYDLNFFDNNVSFNYLFNLDGNITGIFYNNYLIDKNLDLNDLILISGDFNIDFNISKTNAINIVGKNYIAGNYWTYTNGTSPCTDTTGDYICENAKLVFESNDTNYYDYLPLTLTSSYTVPSNGDDDTGGGGGGGGGGSSSVDVNTVKDVNNIDTNELEKEYYLETFDENIIDLADNNKTIENYYIILLDKELSKGEMQIIYITNNISGSAVKELDVNIKLPSINEQDLNSGTLALKTDENGIIKLEVNEVGEYCVSFIQPNGNTKTECFTVKDEALGKLRQSDENIPWFLLLLGLIALIIMGYFIYKKLFKKKQKHI